MKKIATIVAVIALLAVAVPALAYHNNSDVTVTTTNNATVTNTVITGADTGSNIANGGDAVNVVSGNGENGDNDANGGDAGSITTGAATAVADVLNKVNVTRTTVTADCGCKGDVVVRTRNNVSVGNAVDTKAFTGYNATDGGYASNVVTGSFWGWSTNGGNKADGGKGGEITTGESVASSKITNKLNGTVTRVRR